MKTSNPAAKRIALFLGGRVFGPVGRCAGLAVAALLWAGPLLAAAPPPPVLPPASSPAPLSRLLIPAGQQFQLGGGQARAFRFVGRNVGPVPVQVREQLADGRVLERGTVAHGQAVELVFGAGSRALLLNPSTRRAKFRIDASLLNPRELSMNYGKLGD